MNRLFRGVALLLVGGMCAALPAEGATENFELNGSVYTKWLYRNNDTQGVLSYGNPFWPDDIAGDNGVGSEFELNIIGRPSTNVEAGARLKSRFGGLWQDWWESGQIHYDEPNTSGDSLGMNRSQYIKLRGVYVRFAPPIPTVEWIKVGASDLSMFNPWTIGKIRYIDRDNANGTFVEGAFGSDRFLRYQLGVIALPKLWVGPWWSADGWGPQCGDSVYVQRLPLMEAGWITTWVTGGRSPRLAP